MSRLFVVPDLARQPAAEHPDTVADTVSDAVRRLLRTARSSDLTSPRLMQDLLQVAVLVLGIDGAVVMLDGADDIRFGRLPDSPRPPFELIGSDRTHVPFDRRSPAELPTVASVPLFCCGRSWGTLDLYRRPGHTWTTSDLDMAMSLAGVAAAGLALAAAPERTRSCRCEVEHRWAYDEMPGPPGLTLLADLLGRALTTADRHRRVVALLVIDVDGFDDLTGRVSYDVGDLVLAEAAGRLSATVPDGLLLCRPSRTEFAVICESLAGPPSQVDQLLRILGRRIQRDLRGHAPAGGSELVVSATVGGASTRHRCRPEDLISEARAAVHRARLRGSGRIVIGEPGIVPASAPSRTHPDLARLFGVQGSGSRRRGRGPGRRR